MQSSHVEKIALALTSSAVTAVMVYWWTSAIPNGHNDSDDFVAHQGEPTSFEASDPHPHVPYFHQRLSLRQIRRRSQKLLRNCQQRRTLRFFSSDPVPKDVIDRLLQTACTAPSGAHKQPWTFVAIHGTAIKQAIRDMVEQEETVNYQSRMRNSWVQDLKPMMGALHQDMLGNATASASSTDISGGQIDPAVESAAPPTIHIEKPYLTEAPWLIAVFKQTYGIDKHTGKRTDHYYVQESVGIACGMLCVAIQNANLVTLTSTPMGSEKAIRELLDRPDNEKLFLLLPVGFPAKDATVPYRNPERKPTSDSIVWKQI